MCSSYTWEDKHGWTNMQRKPNFRVLYKHCSACCDLPEFKGEFQKIRISNPGYILELQVELSLLNTIS